MDVSSFVPRFKVWVENGDQVALSDWRVSLLEAIGECGSLAAAARSLSVPYKTAWYKLKEIEAALGLVLVTTSSGGAHGGGAELTDSGRDVIRRYHAVVDGLDELVEVRFQAAFAAG